MARVLMVDDNRDMVDTTIALLSFAGHECFPCYRGTEAMACVREHDPDVVLLDIRMPGQSGYDVARSIREANPGAKRPLLIAITAEHGRSGYAARVAEVNGFDYFLTKPIDPKVLLALIEKAQK